MNNHAQLEKLFKHSPGIKLLNAKSAPTIITFFYQTFKDNHITFIEEDQLQQELEDFLISDDIEDEDVEKDDLFIDFRSKALYLIKRWTERNFLRNYENIDNTIVYELTSHTEKVIQWIEQLETKEFIGTESRFKDIFNKIRELVAHTTEDAEKRIKDLEKQKEQIEFEIEQIKSTGKVMIYDDFQIKSRIHEITKSTKELVSDFKEVEDNFKVITRNIYQKHTDPEQTKGGILNYTFDAIDELKDSDQGKSFYAFWDFLIQKSRQDELQGLIKQLFFILDEKHISYDGAFLRKIKQYLFRAGQKVDTAIDRMSDKLSRIISEKELAERIKVKACINRIKELALKLIHDDRLNDIYIEIEDRADIFLPLEKKLTLEKVDAPEFHTQPGTAKSSMDLERMKELYSDSHVNLAKLQRNIDKLLLNSNHVTLHEVLKNYPLQQGLSELISYFRIVDKNNKHYVNKEITELVEFDTIHNKYIEIPQVIFTK